MGCAPSTPTSSTPTCTASSSRYPAHEGGRRGRPDEVSPPATAAGPGGRTSVHRVAGRWGLEKSGLRLSLNAPKASLAAGANSSRANVSDERPPQRRRQHGLFEPVHAAEQCVREVLREVVNAARPAAQVPLQGGAHDAPAQAGP